MDAHFKEVKIGHLCFRAIMETYDFFHKRLVIALQFFTVFLQVKNRPAL
jgi:hypothetical protein